MTRLSGKDRRKAKRSSVKNMAIIVESGGQSRLAWINDLSLTGMRLKSDENHVFASQDSIVVSFGSAHPAIRGRVCWVADEEAGHSGQALGMKFEALRIPPGRMENLSPPIGIPLVPLLSFEDLEPFLSFLSSLDELTLLGSENDLGGLLIRVSDWINRKLAPVSAWYVIEEDDHSKSVSLVAETGPGQDMALRSKLARQAAESSAPAIREGGVFYPGGHVVLEIGDEDTGRDQMWRFMARLVGDRIGAWTRMIIHQIALGLISEGIERETVDRTRAEAALRINEENLRAVFDNSPSAIFVKDLQGRFRMVNRRFEEWFGVSPGEVTGKTFQEAFPRVVLDHFTGIHEQEREVALTGRIIAEERDFLLPGGTRRKMAYSLFPMQDKEGMITRIGTIATDVTTQRTAEEQLRQSQKMELVGQLAGGIAHDFNNLLQIISGYTELLMEEEGMPGSALNHLSQVRNSTERATDLTRQVLAFSRKQVLQFKPLEINDLISRQMKLVSRVLGEAIELHLTLHDEPGVVEGDGGALEQVLLNLCINARDAMPRGGHLFIESHALDAGDAFRRHHPWAEADRYILLSVTDTGTGMEPGVLEHIFEPFFTTKEAGRGSGLGLSMAYGLVRQHGGMLEAESEPGRGSTFKVHLPLLDASPAEETPEEKVKAPPGSETILVAEDEAEVLDLVTLLLENQGYTVLTAANGMEALTVLKEHAPGVDLALLDVVMPGMSGRELFEEIRRIEPTMKVIFNTGYASNSIDSEFLADHRLKLIHKPYLPEELFEALRDELHPS